MTLQFVETDMYELEYEDLEVKPGHTSSVVFEIDITHFYDQPPFRGSPHLCDSDMDYRGFVEIDFTIKGAVWSHYPDNEDEYFTQETLTGNDTEKYIDEEFDSRYNQSIRDKIIDDLIDIKRQQEEE